MSVVKTPGLEIAKTLGKGYYFTPLPYWHEGTDYTWVKLDLQEGDNEIWVYYGSETATDESDGDGVFEFFDDLTSANYTVIRGNSSQVSIVDGSWLRIDASSGYSDKGDIIVKWNESFDLSGNFVVFWKAYLEDPSEWEGVIVEDGSGNGYSGGFYGWSGAKGSIGRWSGYNENLLAQEIPHSLGSTGDTEIYRWSKVGSTLTLYDPNSWTSIVTVNDSTYNSFSYVTFRVYKYAKWKWDWIAIAKYSSSPPSISYSSEESGLWIIDGHTFTKRKKVTITSSQALSGYQIQLDYSQWGEPGIKIMRKVQVVGELG